MGYIARDTLPLIINSSKLESRGQLDSHGSLS
jgi:hypothetical protein